MWIFLYLLFGPILVVALPPLNPGRSRVHERRSSSDSLWSAHSVPHPESIIPLRIGLTQSNMDSAHDELMRISDPMSPEFGKHWTAKEVAEFFAPSKESVNAVVHWLEEEGISRSRVKQSQSLGWLEVANATVAETERLLLTKYMIFLHEPSGHPHLACEEYSLPHHVSDHIDFIMPTVHFDARVNRVKRKRAAPTRTDLVTGLLTGLLGGSDALERCYEQIVPLCLQTLYNIPFDQQFATSKNSFGIVEFSPISYLPTDLDMFFDKFVPQAVGRRPTLDSIDGGQLQPIPDDVESDLDLQYAMTLVYPLNPVLYQIGDPIISGSFNNFLDALDASFCTNEGGDDPTVDSVYPDPLSGGYQGPETCGGFAAAKVISTSYGYTEASLTPAYMIRECNEYMKLGLQGTSFLFSSGDSGVAGEDDVCITSDGDLLPSGTRFAPNFPSTCPYVTSVGATQLPLNASVYDEEVALELGVSSAGGFSDVFSLPSYQSKAVKSYFAQHMPPYSGAQYNNSMTSRGLPDISANGLNYVVADDGTFSLISGTSASTPTVGSIIALVNDARLALGKGPVGFLNPALYANSWVLNDITSGNNPGCGTQGFSAVRGWDPVTGLGTPDYAKLVSLYLTLP